MTIKMNLSRIPAILCVVLGLLAMTAGVDAQDGASEAPLKVCATVSDLGFFAREIGGKDVAVTVFTPPVGDPHFQEARPSFIKALSEADLFLQVGLELESGWAPALQQASRNGKVLLGGKGFFDASKAIEPMDVPATASDRSMGDVHAYGNPHYLLDPLNGLRVATALCETMGDLRPGKRAEFQKRLEGFRGRLGAAFAGEALAKKYDFQKLAVLDQRGKLQDFLRQQGDEKLLGGWLARMLPYRQKKVVVDHGLWPYFARRFGLEVAGAMEPKPGIPPTTRHLGELVTMMQAMEIKAIFASPYYDVKHAKFLAGKTGARIAAMAHQVGSRPGTDDYISMIGYNVGQVVEALGAKE